MKKDIIKPIVVLVGICLVVTAVLAYVNQITAPIIKEANDKATAEARAEVLAEADEFIPVDIPEEFTSSVAEIHKAKNGSGYVLKLVAKGYGGKLELICGIRSDDTIEQVKMLTNSETSGIGSRVVNNDQPYRQQYVGKSADKLDEVDAVSGATISSKAYKGAIETAFKAYETVKEAKE
jgi:electron transport complex protein RnfG